MKKEMSLQKESEWDENIKESFLKELDFLSDHWVNGDDKPPFSFGGWREDVAYEFVAIVKYWVLQREKEIAEEVEKILERHISWKPTEGYESEEECGFQKGLMAEAKLLKKDLLQIIKH